MRRLKNFIKWNFSIGLRLYRKKLLWHIFSPLLLMPFFFLIENSQEFFVLVSMTNVFIATILLTKLFPLLKQKFAQDFFLFDVEPFDIKNSAILGWLTAFLSTTLMLIQFGNPFIIGLSFFFFMLSLTDTYDTLATFLFIKNGQNLIDSKNVARHVHNIVTNDSAPLDKKQREYLDERSAEGIYHGECLTCHGTGHDIFGDDCERCHGKRYDPLF